MLHEWIEQNSQITEYNSWGHLIKIPIPGNCTFYLHYFIFRHWTLETRIPKIFEPRAQTQPAYQLCFYWVDSAEKGHSVTAAVSGGIEERWQVHPGLGRQSWGATKSDFFFREHALQCSEAGSWDKEGKEHNCNTLMLHWASSWRARRVSVSWVLMYSYHLIF